MYLSVFVPQIEWMKCNTQYFNKLWPMPFPAMFTPCWPLSIHPSYLLSQPAFAFCLFLGFELSTPLSPLFLWIGVTLCSLSGPSAALSPLF